MKKVYFDKMIYTLLLNNRDYINQISNAKSQNKITIYYSDYILFECLKREYQENIEKELSLISEITENNFISIDFIETKQEPFERVLELNDIKANLPINESFEVFFNEELQLPHDNNSLNNQFNRVKLFNINPAEIYNELNNIIYENNEIEKIEQFNLEKIKKEFFDENIIGDISDIFNEYIDQEGKKISPDLLKEEANSFFKNLDVLLDNIKDKKGNFFENISKMGGDYLDGFEVGIYSGLLNLFNYNPDSNDLKKKKGFLGECDEMHVSLALKLGTFVSNDKKLMKRTNAALLALNKKLELLSFEDFINNL